MQFSILAEKPFDILVAVTSLLACKIVLLKVSAHLLNHESRNAWLFSVLLSQGGKFVFVLFAAARGFGALTEQQAAELTLMVALSIFTTPFLLKATGRFLKDKPVQEKTDADKIDSEHSPVIIAGMGRFGQIVARLLHTQGISPTIIDFSPDLLDLVRPFGFKVYQGDATEMTLLESAGIAHAKVLVLALDDRDGCLRAAELVRKHYPQVRIMARAFDMIHAYQLKDPGVEDFERETFNAVLSLGEKVLVSLGFHPHAARRFAKFFHRYDSRVVHDLHRVYKQLIERVMGARAAREELQKLFAEDEKVMEQGHADADWLSKLHVEKTIF